MLESLALEHPGPAGFFGPQSLIWNGTREAAVLLGGGRAALMQLAHPAVAHAIRDHSAVHRDMLGRFVRTMSGAYGILFGSVDEALSISSRLFEKHRSIRGTLDDIPGHPPAPYHALSAEANFWVGATLIETAVVVLERTIQPFTNAQRDRIIEEMAPFWALFGIRPADCPTRWSQLQDYIHERVAVFAPLVGDTAREQARLLFQAQSRLLQPAFDQVRLVVAEQLPGPLQDAFGMQLSPPERLLARGWMFAAERLTPHLPGRLRYIPQYHRAARRLLRA
jgi:uncharacterized protein (DUF2236 family)